MMSGDAIDNKTTDPSIHHKFFNNCDLLLKCPPKTREKHFAFYHKARERVKSFSVEKLLIHMFPLWSIINSFYNKKAFLYDVLAGLTVSSLHVPQGMAYGQLAGVKPINGIYTSFFPAMVYILFGASRHVSIGTFSVMSLLVSEPVDRLAESFVISNQTDTDGKKLLDDYRLEVAITVTVVVGIMQVLMGLFRLGLLVAYISPAILGGFTCGAAIHVFASQLNGLFGIRLQRTIGPGRLLFTAQNFCYAIAQTNLVTLSLSVGCITILALFKFLINPFVYAKTRFSVPIELILLILTTAFSHFTQLSDKYNVAVAGTLPRGLPLPKIPDFSIAAHVWLECAIAAFVSLATTMSVIKLYATRYAYSVEYTREMSVLGLSNIFGGFLQCHACSGGLARTSVAVGAGMQTQVATIISCCVLFLVVTCMGSLLQTLPLCVLSSIITISLKGILVQMTELPKLYRTSLIDLSIWVVSFLATVLVDIPYGLLIALCFSLITILYRTHSAEKCTMGRVPGTNIYLSQNSFDGTESLPGVLLLQTTGPIYYANAEGFRNWLIRSTGIDPDIQKVETITFTDDSNSKNGSNNNWYCNSLGRCCRNNNVHLSKRNFNSRTKHEDEISWVVEHTDVDLIDTPAADTKFIILDMSGCYFTDTVGVSVLNEMVRKYKGCSIDFLLCSCSWHVRSILLHGGFDTKDLDRKSFPTMHDAVLHAQNIMQKSDGGLHDMNLSDKNIH